jgi:Tfp pilus assembly protein PilO
MDNSKQKQEMKTSNFIGLLAVITILVVLVGGLVAKNLATSFLHNQRIISKKNLAQKTLAADAVNAKTVTKQYQDLGTQQQQLLVDSLPADSDIPGLANIMEAMGGVSGVQFLSVSSTGSAVGEVAPVTGASPTATGSLTTAASQVPISITFQSSYANLDRFLASLENSSRPITVSSIQLTGTSSKLNVTLSATTYYQTPVTFSVTKEAVQ